MKPAEALCTTCSQLNPWKVQDKAAEIQASQKALRDAEAKIQDTGFIEDPAVEVPIKQGSASGADQHGSR